MALPDDVFPTGDRCELCGADLGNEVVIQEYEDGTFARLCPDCYAEAPRGQGLEATATGMTSGGAGSRDRGSSGFFPDPDDLEDGLAKAFGAEGDSDPLEMTRELLVPLTDLMNLQSEMQAALGRLADSLDRFASQVVTDSVGKTATMENRIRSLEAELERTRNSLREAESLLVVATGASMAQREASDGPPPPFTSPPAVAVPQDREAKEDKAFAQAARGAETPVDEAVGVAAGPQDDETIAYDPMVEEPGQATAGYWTTISSPEPPSDTPPVEMPPSTATCSDIFTLDEVRRAQRYFNESSFTSRMRDVRRSLGRPRANLSRLAGTDPRAFVTIFWDIVWYQYLVDLRVDAPSGDRVTLFREGMELGELSECFKQKNATMDDSGRLDASEVEVQLLSDPTVLIADTPEDEDQEREDATEEIWDNHVAPEFKWDD